MRPARPFKPSPEKRHIRVQYDKPLVEELRNLLGRPLRYLGLPGPHMDDVLTWQESLGSCVGVEYDGDQADLLLEAAFLSRLSSRLTVVQADIEDYIARILPTRGGEPFDVINLDYFGPPLLITDTGESGRYSALERLFEFQGRHTRSSFLLFVTTGVRNRDRGLVDKILNGLRRNVPASVLPAPTASQYVKMKVVVPHLVRAAAAPRWDVKLRYGFTYQGTESVRMVHFAFWVKPGALTVHHEQSEAEFCSVPLLDLKGTTITPLS